MEVMMEDGKPFLILVVIALFITVVWFSISNMALFKDQNLETNVQCYKITIPTFKSGEAIYTKEYEQIGESIHMDTWWKDNGAMIWSPYKHTGDLWISEYYSIETVTCSSLPK